MGWSRRLGWMTALAILGLALAAGAASAQTFYVEQRGGDDLYPCTTAQEPCETIKAAIKKAESFPAPNRIEVAPAEGAHPVYNETVELLSQKDAGLTINGEAPGVTIEGLNNPALIAAFGGDLTLSNLNLRTGARPRYASLRS